MKKLLGKIASFILAVTACCGFSACQSNTIVVYTEAGFAPFEYVSGGKIVGVDVDIMNMVGEKLGKKVVFKNVNFDVIVDAVAQGKLTNVGAAGISVTPGRQAKVDFSNEYYTANLYVSSCRRVVDTVRIVDEQTARLYRILELVQRLLVEDDDCVVLVHDRRTDLLIAEDYAHVCSTASHLRTV